MHGQGWRLENRVATLLVILLFPVFFLYNSGLSKGWFPQFAGGWYGPVSLFLGIPFALFMAVRWVMRGRRVLVVIDIFVYIFILFCLIWSSFFYSFGLGYNSDAHQFLYTVEGLMLWFVTYIAFKHCIYEGKAVVKTFLLLWFVMAIIAISGGNNGMYYAAQQAVDDYSLQIASYQGFARSALVVSAVILATLQGWRLVLFSGGSLILLFVLGARTEFVGIVIVTVCIMFAERRNMLLRVGGISAVLLIVSVIAYQYANFVDQSRVLNLLHLGNDSSWQERSVYQQVAWTTISEHWLFGDFGSQQLAGSSGAYSHNALSAWVAYGFFGFLQFTLLNLFCMGYTGWMIVSGKIKSKGLAAFAFAMSSYCVVCMIFAKSVGDPVFAISWGSTAAVFASRQKALAQV